MKYTEFKKVYSLISFIIIKGTFFRFIPGTLKVFGFGKPETEKICNKKVSTPGTL